MVDNWAEKIVADDQRRREFLAGWQEEIRGVKRYGKVPVHPHDAVRIADEYVVPRLGPELTAIGRAVGRLERYSRRAAQRHLDDPEHRDVHDSSNLAWGARQAFAVGLGVRLNLSFEEATWLADALAGYEYEHIVKAEAELKSTRGHQADH